MTRTRPTHALAYTLMVLCIVGVFTTPGPSWVGVIFGLATVLAGVVLVKPIDRVPVVSSDDTFAHPSSPRSLP